MHYCYVRFILLFFLGGFAYSVVGQTVPNSLDSLEQYLRIHSPTDSNYVRALNRTARKLLFERADYARADSLLERSEPLARTIGWWPGLSGAYNVRATRYHLTAEPNLALQNFQKAVQVIEAHNLSRLDLYAYLGNVAMAQGKLGQWGPMMQTALRAIRLQEQYQLKTRYANTYTAVADALKNLGRPQQALPYAQEALAIDQQSGNKQGEAISLNKLGNLYDDLNQPRQALTYYQASLKLADEIEFDLLQTDGLINIARMFDALRQPVQGLPYAQKALRLAQKEGNAEAMATAYCNIGLLYQSLKDYAQAETYQKKALGLANKLRDQEKIKLYSQGLADLYAEQNKYREAYAFQRQKNNLIDSTVAVRTNAEVQRLIARYETDKKEAQIRLLQQEKQLQQQAAERARWQTNALLIGAGLLLLLGVAITAWLLNRARLRRLQEAQALRKQIAHDLHDEVGSTLSSISLLSGMVNSLIAQQRPEAVERAIQRINTDARQILEAMDEIIWTINPGNDSLQRIALRLQEYAQPLMESKAIRFSFEIDPMLETQPISMEVRRNLYLIGKEAINNLVKYSAATQATVRFTYDQGQLRVLIEDNGQGFDPARLSMRTGQQSMQERARAIGGTLTVRSALGHGTRLQLTTDL